MLECYRPIIVAIERQLAGEHLIHDDAERINVAPAVYRQTTRLLRRNIMHRTNRFVFHIGHFRLKVRNAKIRNLDDPVFHYEDVLRLDVPVDNALAVRVAERPCDLQGKIYRLRRVQRAMLLEILLERDAVDQLHDNVFHVIGAAHIVYSDDVRMAQLGDRLRFRLEAAAELLVFRKLRPHDLHRHIAVETVAHRFIYNRHAAAANELYELIPAVEHHAAVFVLIFCIHIVPP